MAKKVSKDGVKAETVKQVSRWVRIPRDVHELALSAERAMMVEKVNQNAKLMQLESSLSDAKDKLAIIEAILLIKKLEAVKVSGRTWDIINGFLAKRGLVIIRLPKPIKYPAEWTK